MVLVEPPPQSLFGWPKNWRSDIQCCIPFFPQQRKLMGSSAHNSSGVRWCRRRVRFNKVPEKVPGGFGAEPGQVQQGSVEHSGKGSKKPWCKARSSSTGSVEGSGEGLGGFGAKSGQVQQGFGEGSEVLEKVWEALVQSQVKFNRVPEKVPMKVPEKVPGVFGAGFRRRLQKRFQKALVQSQVRFNCELFWNRKRLRVQPDMHYSICAM